MKLSKPVILMLILLASLAVLTCELEPYEFSPIFPAEVLQNEAEHAAIWLSNELYAPKSLTNEILADLAQIRAKFENQIPNINEARFLYPAMEKRLIMMFDEENLDLFMEGNYHAWDELNLVYGTETQADSGYSSGEGFYFAWLIFPEPVNLFLIEQEYDKLDGADATIVNYYCGMHQRFLVPWPVSGDMAYLFVDTKSGYTSHGWTAWYVKKSDGEFELIGSTRLGDQEQPIWWDEIKYTLCMYWHRLATPCEHSDWINF